MAKKTVKKVDVKKVAKMEVSDKIKEMFQELGIEIGEGVDYGMTAGTLVLAMEKCDVQVKLITPKAGVDRYEKLVDEEEEEEEEIIQEKEISTEEEIIQEKEDLEETPTEEKDEQLQE